jgi:hypothetical protein
MGFELSPVENVVQTITAEEYRRLRDAADLVHIVARERSEGAWD